MFYKRPYNFLLIVLFLAITNKKTLNVTAESIRIKVKGMTCSHCESNVVDALLGVSGIESVQADYQSGEVILEGSNYDINKIEEVINSLNYKVI